MVRRNIKAKPERKTWDSKQFPFGKIKPETPPNKGRPYIKKKTTK